MTEEETEIIDILNKCLFWFVGEKCEIGKDEIRKILKFIGNQQKEIAELKEKNVQLTNYLNDSYYVSVDEIKVKLKELEEQEEKLQFDGNVCFADYEQFCKNHKFFKEQIKELLEEN